MLQGVIWYLIQGVFYVGHLWILWAIVFPEVGVADTRGTSTDTLLTTCIGHYILLTIVGSGYYWHRQSRWRLIRNAELEKRHLQLEKEKLKAERDLIEKERNFLKNQFNEHTIFNFFNSLYRKVYKKVPEAGEAIALFSDFLSYSLRLEFDNEVSLKDEVEFINNYIEIQRILKKDLSLDYKQTGPIDQVSIPPYVFFPFVENAFKHGIVNDPDHPLRIKLNINGKIDFEVSNLKNPRTVHSSGIGQTNVKRMLDVYYKDQYNLIIENEQEKYSVHLTINHVD